jgi:hypothetical protein
MGSLETYQVEDWAQFIEKEEIDRTCPACKGETEKCEECNGSGYIEPMWNTIWNTGFHHCDNSPAVPTEVGPVFAFRWNDQIWFGLTGCGMDLTPHLAKAWITLFPECTWLPDQFIVRGVNLTQGYIVSCLGKTWARKVYRLIGKTIQAMRHEAAWLAKDLRVAREHLKTQK